MAAPLIVPLLSLLLTAQSPSASDGRGSLQEYLVKARAQRDALLSTLRERTDAILKEIDAAAVVRDQVALLALRERFSSPAWRETMRRSWLRAWWQERSRRCSRAALPKTW